MRYLPEGLGRVSPDEEDVLEYAIKDHLGNTRLNLAVTSVPIFGTSVVQSYDYYPYGFQVKLADGAHKLTETFTGKELDEQTGLYYFGARYYDPEIAMWISPDPMRQFHSPYSYTGNGMNPINAVDPTGMLQVVETTSEGASFEQMDPQNWGEGVLQIDANGVGMMLSESDASTAFSIFADGNMSLVDPTNGLVTSFPAWSGGSWGADPTVAGKYYFMQDNVQSWADLSTSQKALANIGRGQWPGGTNSWGNMRSELIPTAQTRVNILGAGRSGNFFIHGGTTPGSRGCIDLLGNDANYFYSVGVSSSPNAHPVYVPR